MMFIVAFSVNEIDASSIERRFGRFGLDVFFGPSYGDASDFSTNVIDYLTVLRNKIGASSFFAVSSKGANVNSAWILDAAQFGEDVIRAEKALNAVASAMRSSGFNYILFLKDLDQLEPDPSYKAIKLERFGENLVREQNLIELRFANAKLIRVYWGANLLCELT